MLRRIWIKDIYHILGVNTFNFYCMIITWNLSESIFSRTVFSGLIWKNYHMLAFSYRYYHVPFRNVTTGNSCITLQIPGNTPYWYDFDKKQTLQSRVQTYYKETARKIYHVKCKQKPTNKTKWYNKYIFKVSSII